MKELLQSYEYVALAYNIRYTFVKIKRVRVIQNFVRVDR